MRRVGATWVREETKSGSPEFKVQRSGCGRGSAGSVPALRGAGCPCSEGGGGQRDQFLAAGGGAPRTAPIRVGERFGACMDMFKKRGGGRGEGKKKKK